MNELHFNNFNKVPDTSTTGTTTAVSSSTYCKYRLPCGFCELRRTQCTIHTHSYYNLDPCTITTSDTMKKEVVTSWN